MLVLVTAALLVAMPMRVARAFQFEMSGDMFGDMFGGGGQQQQRLGHTGKPRANDVQLELSVDLAGVYNGVSQSVNINGRRKVCSDCRGTGAEGGRVKKCGKCRGQGQVQVPVNMGGMVMHMQQPCDRCGGKGVVYKKACRTCGGSGIVDNNAPIEANIEKGMLNGDTLIFENEGSVEDPDNDPGDLGFEVKVNEKGSKFKRQEVGLTNDLRTSDTITLREALLGFEHQIMHMDGHRVNFGYRGVTQPYQLRRIQGEGMPIRGAEGLFGDLVVEHRVRYPDRVTDSQKEALVNAFGSWPRPKAETLICAAPPCTIS
jgi:DnaJ-related protein SCJ1